MNRKLEASLKDLIAAFRAKGEEFKDVIKMGRTQLQDAVPMTSGQEFHAYATNLEEEVANLERNVNLLYEINISVPSEEEAKRVCQNFRGYSEDIYSFIMKNLLQ